MKWKIQLAGLHTGFQSKATHCLWKSWEHDSQGASPLSKSRPRVVPRQRSSLVTRGQHQAVSLLRNFWKIVEYGKRASNFKFHQDSDLRNGYRTSLRGVKSSTLHKVFEKTGKIFNGASPKHRTPLPLTLSGGERGVSEAQFNIFLALVFPLQSPRPSDSSAPKYHWVLTCSSILVAASVWSSL